MYRQLPGFEHSPAGPATIEPNVKIAVVSTYPPRECGLATFAADLCESLTGAGCREVGVIEMVRATDSSCPSEGASVSAGGRASSPRQLAVIHDDCIGDYRRAAMKANEWADVVIVEHEFGIYGGQDGSMLSAFLQNLTVPYVLTLHTVLTEFSPSQSTVLRQICRDASVVTVFTATAKRLLSEQGVTSRSKIVCVPHGAPAALYEADREEARSKLGMEGKTLLSSFGLLSSGKGLELAVESLAVAVAAGVDAHLVIAGKTHPDVLRREGERYRNSLAALAADIGVGERVRFLDGFLAIEGIAELLVATDVFVTPYVGQEQIVSGALTFALAAGCPVVSTPYLYAVDQLSSGAGILVGDREPAAFGEAIISLVTDTDRLAAARDNSAAIGSEMRWSAIGERVAQLCSAIVRHARNTPVQPLRVGASASTPTPIGRGHANDVRGQAAERQSTHLVPHRAGAKDVSANAKDMLVGALHRPGERDDRDDRAASRPSTIHLARLTDSRGIVQHATGIVPLLSSGYCVDDVSRLIPVARSLAAGDQRWHSTVARSVAFLAHAHEPGTAMLRNFMNWTGAWEDEPHFGDHVGRALMGLSGVSSSEGFDTLVGPLVADILRHWPEDSPLHPEVYALIAQWADPNIANLRVSRGMLDRLMAAYREAGDPDWVWPEPRVRYDQARFPQALLAGGSLLDDNEALDLGFASLAWYTRRFDQGSHLRFPGHRGWGKDEPVQWTGDEQPLEAFAFVEAHLCAYSLSGDAAHLRMAEKGNAWFAGANRLATPLADFDDGSCRDGLGSVGTNRNCGAESTLAMLASGQRLRGAMEHLSLRGSPVTVGSVDEPDSPAPGREHMLPPTHGA